MYSTPTRSSGQATSLVQTPQTQKVYPSLGPLQAMPSAYTQPPPASAPAPVVPASAPVYTPPVPISKPVPAKPATPQITPAARTDISPAAIRTVHARLAFRNLRNNTVFLFALWWLTSSRPYQWLLMGLKQAGYTGVKSTLGYSASALCFLFLINILYSSFQFFFPSSTPPVVPSMDVAANASTDAVVMDLPLRSSPKVRPSTPGTPISNRKTTGTPSHLKHVLPAQRQPSSGSPLAALKATLLSHPPGGHPNSPQKTSREDVLKEQAFLSRHSPRRVVSQSEPSFDPFR